LDADKEGFLRSKTSLIQTIGRAARNVDGKAILYADKITDSMQYAIDETDRRREKQVAYNEEHGITPETVRKALGTAFDNMRDGEAQATVGYVGLSDNEQDMLDNDPKALRKHIEALKAKMLKAAENLEFEEAASLRDQVKKLEESELGL